MFIQYALIFSVISFHLSASALAGRTEELNKLFDATSYVSENRFVVSETDELKRGLEFGWPVKFTMDDVLALEEKGWHSWASVNYAEIIEGSSRKVLHPEDRDANGKRVVLMEWQASLAIEWEDMNEAIGEIIALSDRYTEYNSYGTVLALEFIGIYQVAYERLVENEKKVVAEYDAKMEALEGLDLSPEQRAKVAKHISLNKKWAESFLREQGVIKE